MDREFDVLVFGASGYTGRLVAEYLLKQYGVGKDVHWGIAGRNADKLAKIRDEIGAPVELPIVVADSAKKDQLVAMVKRTKALITTAGPYQYYGDLVVEACAEEGTDYVDLAGESNWIADKTAALEDVAKKSGARLVFSCGFDSIPFDLGVFYTQEEAKKKLGHYLPRVRGRVRDMKGGLSGGTAASGQATMEAAQKDPSVITKLMNPYCITPGLEGPVQPDLNTAYYDDVVESWVAPFMMAAINTKAVHRSNYLLGQPWGQDFIYDEMLMVEGDPAQGGTAADFDMSNPPKPGEGPTKQEREEGFYDVIFIGEDAAGKQIQTCVKGDMDPGYGSTSKMLAESALCLAKDISRDRTPGGAYSTAPAMGPELIKRLTENAGLTFAVES